MTSPLPAGIPVGKPLSLSRRGAFTVLLYVGEVTRTAICFFSTSLNFLADVAGEKSGAVIPLLAKERERG